MFETLTAMLAMLEKTKPEQWILAESGDDGELRDGSAEHSYVMSGYIYGPEARQLMEAIGRFAHEHGEFNLYDYPRILKEAGLWERPDEADVSTRGPALLGRSRRTLLRRRLPRLP